MKDKKKEQIITVLALGLVFGLFTISAYATQTRSVKGVWTVQPFFVYNLTRGDGGPNHLVENQQVVRIYSVENGNRINLYGNVDYSLVSDDPYPVENTSRYVIEGTRIYKYSNRNLDVWIKVDRMYEYALCLDENGFIDHLPYQGELPQ